MPVREDRRTPPGGNEKGYIHIQRGSAACAAPLRFQWNILRSFDDQVDAAVVSGSLIQLEGEGVTLAHDGCGGGGLHGVELRRSHHDLATEGHDPVVQAGEQVGARDLGGGAQDGTAGLAESELVPRENLLVGDGFSLGGEHLEDALHLGLVRSPDASTVTTVTDVLPVLHLCSGHALGAAAHLLEGDGRNVLHSVLGFRSV